MSQSTRSVLATVFVLLCNTVAGMRSIHLCVNPFGGGGAGLDAKDAVLPMFQAAGIDVTLLETQYAGHAGDYARTLELLDGFVGIGGDGTAHEIANAMLKRPEHERVPIGIVPAGSGNTWALDLGLSDPVEAARAIIASHTQMVDVMAISPTDQESSSVQEYAINIAGYGMPAAVLEQANALRVLGSAQYELAGLILIATGKTTFAATLVVETADGETITRELDDFRCTPPAARLPTRPLANRARASVLQHSFAQGQVNMHMGKQVCFAPGARMADGLLDLVLITRSGGADILRANAMARAATHVELPFVEMIRCKSYELRPRAAPPRLKATLNLDGELLNGMAPFRAECVPNALEVYASQLNEKPMDTSEELEPQLVLALLGLFDR